MVREQKGEFIHLLLLFYYGCCYILVQSLRGGLKVVIVVVGVWGCWVKLYFLASQFEPVHHFL